MSDECTRSRHRCEGCERPICRRCGRCFERVPADPYATLWEYRCPSHWCRLLKRLHRGKLRREDTPRKGVCTGGKA